MGSIEQMIAMQGAIEKYISSMTTPTAGIVEAMQRNSRLVEKALAPQLGILGNIEAINRAVAGSLVIPNNLVTVMKRYEDYLPNSLKTFSVASALLETFRRSELLVPAYMAKSQYDLSMVFATSRGMGQAYDHLLKQVSEQTIIPAYARDFISRPSISTASHFRVLRSAKILDSEKSAALEADFKAATDSDFEESKDYISRVEPEWLVLLGGAEEAVRSSNPDRVRHAITSLRELLTQVIHRFAPDDAVKSRLPDGKWYHEGRPTRKARLYFILVNKYDSDVLLDFVERDVDAVLALFDLFQKGTHEIVSSIEPGELQYILKRTKALLCELLNDKT